MARIEDPCIRCIRPTPATETITFGLNGNWYKAKLCGRHADQFDSDQRMMIRLSEPIEAEWEVQQTLRARQERNGVERVNGGIIQPVAARTTVATMEPPQQAKKMPGAFVQVPIAFDIWHITGHAKVRMRERDVGLPEALWAIEHYDRKWDHYEMVDCEWRRRGDVKVLVNREEYAVISVANAAESEEEI